MVAAIGIMHSDVSATDVNSRVSLLTTTLLLIPSGFRVSAIGSALVISISNYYCFCVMFWSVLSFILLMEKIEFFLCV